MSAPDFSYYEAARRLGAALARESMIKTAEGEYEETVSEHSPIAHRVGQHAMVGAALGGGLGLLAPVISAALKKRFRGTAVPPLAGALVGAGLGVGTGTIHGAYDAGKVHALKRLENPEHDDFPTLRAGAAGAALGPNALLAMLASERGKVNALSDPNAGEAIAALRRSRGGLW